MAAFLCAIELLVWCQPAIKGYWCRSQDAAIASPARNMTLADSYQLPSGKWEPFYYHSDIPCDQTPEKK